MGTYPTLYGVKGAASRRALMLIIHHNRPTIVSPDVFGTCVIKRRIVCFAVVSRRLFC